MVDSGKTFKGKKIGYEIVDDGYIIYLDGEEFLSQTGDRSKLFVPNGTYEENMNIQIGVLANTPNDEEPNIVQLRADVDYIAAMCGIGLV